MTGGLGMLACDLRLPAAGLGRLSALFIDLVLFGGSLALRLCLDSARFRSATASLGSRG
jgi:hypothetical protein